MSDHLTDAPADPAATDGSSRLITLEHYRDEALAAVAYVVSTSRRLRILRNYAKKGFLSGKVEPVGLPHDTLANVSELGPSDIDAAWKALANADQESTWLNLTQRVIGKDVADRVLALSQAGSEPVVLADGYLQTIAPTNHSAAIELGVRVSLWVASVADNRDGILECNARYAGWRESHQENSGLIFLGVAEPAIGFDDLRSRIWIEYRDANRGLAVDPSQLLLRPPKASGRSLASDPEMDEAWARVQENLMIGSHQLRGRVAGFMDTWRAEFGDVEAPMTWESCVFWCERLGISNDEFDQMTSMGELAERAAEYLRRLNTTSSSVRPAGEDRSENDSHDGPVPIGSWRFEGVEIPNRAINATN